MVPSKRKSHLRLCRRREGRIQQKLAVIVVLMITSLFPRRVSAFVAWLPIAQRSVSRESRKARVARHAASKTDEYNPRRPKSKKIRVNPNITQENFDLLAQAFDDMAKKEGFDSSTAIYAADEGFDDNDEDASISDDMEFSMNDFVDEDDDDDEFLDFGQGAGGSMEDRIAAARRNSVSVPEEMEDFSRQRTAIKELGFKTEQNPFGNDETPRQKSFRLVENAMTCSACGSDFQQSDETRPGYLPPEKFDIQVKLSKIEELQAVQDKAESKEWTPEDEIEWLIQTQGKTPEEIAQSQGIDVDSAADELGLDLEAHAEKKVVCKRCHGLQNFGKVEESLRPGWTEEPLLSQARFRDLLRPIRDKPAVIVALVDIFDFAGSVLPELDGIAGENPVILAANKADLLPSTMGKTRVESWVRRELEYMGIRSLANIGGAVRLVSCKTGAGIGAMLDKARALAEEMDAEIYVVGAANAGKSTLLNHILERDSDNPKRPGKIRAGNKNAIKGAVTTSPLPGTTLKFIKVDLGEGRALYDTPGLLVPGTLTQLLTPEELKMVVPSKQVESVTFRLNPGQCVLIGGGLARIELAEESRPFLFTFFVANGIKLHVTKSEKADDFVREHTGNLLTPPMTADRGAALIESLDTHSVTVDGAGWKEAGADIALTGLGWVAVTGAGPAHVHIRVPQGMGVAVRPPLMPFDIWDAAAKYTGSKAVRKPSKKGKKRRGVGRR